VGTSFTDIQLSDPLYTDIAVEMAGIPEMPIFENQWEKTLRGDANTAHWL